MRWASLAIAALAAVIMMIPLAADAATFNPEEVAKVDQIVANALAEVGTPSASVAVVRRGELVFAKSYGLRRLDPAESATPQTRYLIESVSKQFTAAAVLILADEGKVSLDERLSRYLPELGSADRRTVRQAMNHTAGFPDFWTVDFAPTLVLKPVSPREIVERWAKAPPLFSPGSSWSYSNTDYVVLGRLVERASGQSLGAFVHQRIFLPLGMSSASDMDGKPLRGDDAHGYARAAAGPPREAPRVAAGWTFGCGELSMTAADLARWDMGVLGHRLMSPAAYAAFETEAKLADGSATGYGLGVFVDRASGHRRLRHNGDLPGFWTENRVYLDDDLAIVVMVNGSYGGSPHAVIANGIEAMMLPSEPAAAIRGPPSPDQVLSTMFRQIAKDQLDRSHLSDEASAYLSGAVLADYRESFRKLGSPLAVLPVSDTVDHGVHVGRWVLVWPDTKLMFAVQLGKDGKVEEFFAYPVWLRPRQITSP